MIIFMYIMIFKTTANAKIGINSKHIRGRGEWGRANRSLYLYSVGGKSIGSYKCSGLGSVVNSWMSPFVFKNR